MRHAREASPISSFRADALSGRDGASLVQRAPGPEAPEARDKSGAQIGMLILLAGGVAFWTAVGAIALHYLL
jgi:hypothetical protein